MYYSLMFPHFEKDICNYYMSSKHLLDENTKIIKQGPYVPGVPAFTVPLKLSA